VIYEDTALGRLAVAVGARPNDDVVVAVAVHVAAVLTEMPK
jgi:hypothetical protein